jgi:hypothetical protein
MSVLFMTGSTFFFGRGPELAQQPAESFVLMIQGVKQPWNIVSAMRRLPIVDDFHEFSHGMSLTYCRVPSTVTCELCVVYTATTQHCFMQVGY